MKQKHLPQEFYSYLIIKAQIGMGQSHHLKGYIYAAGMLQSIWGNVV